MWLGDSGKPATLIEFQKRLSDLGFVQNGRDFAELVISDCWSMHFVCQSSQAADDETLEDQYCLEWYIKRTWDEKVFGAGHSNTILIADWFGIEHDGTLKSAQLGLVSKYVQMLANV